MNQVQKDALYIVNKYCSQAQILGIMLTGSYADNTQSPESDIDIVVMSELSCKQTHENIIEEGRMYQLIIMPYRKIASTLYDDLKYQRWVIISMFTKGVILLDKTGILKKIKDFAYSFRFPPRHEHETLILRRLITHEFESLKGYKEQTSGLCTATEIIRDTARLITGLYGLKGNYLDRSMSIHAKEIKLLNKALTEYLQNKNVEIFSNRIEKLLQPFGGFLKRFTTNYLFMTPNEKFMLLFIPKYSMNSPFVKELILSIKKLCQNCDCYSFYESKGQAMENGTYISIHSETIQMRTIYLRLEKHKEQILNECLERDIHLSYPYQSSFYEGNYFGGIDVFTSLIPIFEKVSNLLFSIYHKNSAQEQSLRLTTALRILYYFVNISFDNNIAKSDFLAKCLSIYLPDIVDINSMYNINQLVQIREELMHLYDKLYDNEKESLAKFFYSEKKSSNKFCEKLRDEARTIHHILEGHQVTNFVSIGLYTNTEEALFFHVLNHILSIFNLSSQEKFALIHKLLKCSTDNAIW